MLHRSAPQLRPRPDVHTSNGRLESRRADNGAFLWSTDIPGSGEGDSASPTSSPAVLQLGTTNQWRVVVGTMDGRVIALDARNGAEAWRYPTNATSPLVPVLASPTISPGGNVVVPMGERLVNNPFRAFYAIWRFNPWNGSPSVVWGMGATWSFGSGYEPSSVAMDFAGNACVGLPGTDPDYPSNNSGVLAVRKVDGGTSGLWQATFANDGYGVSATPAVSGGRVFVNTRNGLRSLNASTGGVLAGPVFGSRSQSSSPAVAGEGLRRRRVRVDHRVVDPPRPRHRQGWRVDGRQSDLRDRQRRGFAGVRPVATRRGRAPALRRARPRAASCLVRGRFPH
jgi:outer membrane protein assembly factor BamB